MRYVVVYLTRDVQLQSSSVWFEMNKPWFDGAFINYTWFGIVSVFITPHSHAMSTNQLRSNISMFKTKKSNNTENQRQ